MWTLFLLKQENLTWIYRCPTVVVDSSWALISECFNPYSPMISWWTQVVNKRKISRVHLQENAFSVFLHLLNFAFYLVSYLLFVKSTSNF